MSENLNRGIRDFSKYDSMETEELEQILRLDAEAPEDTESDTELLLYVMEVLASRRNNTNITGNTAQQAWESFQQNYLPQGVHNRKSQPNNKFAVAPWVRRLIAAAAVIVLVIVVPVSAKAFSLERLWDVIATWAKETFSFVSSEYRNDVKSEAEDNLEYTSLQDLLERNNRSTNIVPVWIPDGFILEKIEQAVSPVREVYRATYQNGSKVLIIRIQSFVGSNPEKIEVNEELIEIYNSGKLAFYIFSNNEHLQTIWLTDSYECYITGDLSIDELKQMIDSIKKG